MAGRWWRTIFKLQLEDGGGLFSGGDIHKCSVKMLFPKSWKTLWFYELSF